MAVNGDPVGAERAAKAIFFIRILVGWAFLSEGIQKFLFPEALGVARFVKISIPGPNSWPSSWVWLRLIAAR